MNRLFAFLAAVALAGCATTQDSGGQVIVTKEAPRIVQVRCEDKRGPAPALPDTDEKLAAIPDGDIFSLAQAFRAGRELRDQRLKEDDRQIAACVGDAPAPAAMGTAPN